MTGLLRRVTALEALALAALAAVSCVSLVLVLVRAVNQGGTWAGGDGLLVTDQLQYLNWLRQAGHHVAVANLYDLAPGPRSFVHPGVLLSGLLDRLGLGIRLAYLVWKPVAVLALWAAALLLARRFLARAGDRTLALVLALLACSPAAALVGWTGWGGPGTHFQFDFASGEVWPGFSLSGYEFSALAVAAVPLGLLAYERGRDGDARWVGLAALAGLVAAWLQPWQGATYAGVLVVAELAARRVERRPWRASARTLVPALAATGAPLVYYLALSRLDASWRLAGLVNELPRWPWWVSLAVLGPLGLPALLAYARRPRDWGEWALRAWVPMGLLVFVQPAGTFPAHAFQGLELPLAVLAVAGVRERLLGARAFGLAPAALVVAVLVVPGTAYRIDRFAGELAADRQAFVLRPGERAALGFLARDRRPGGVLAPIYSGAVIPAWTGRETWIGAGSWTPDYEARRRATESLFEGHLGRRAAGALVRRSGAAFLLTDCHHPAGRRLALGSVAGPPRRFGCAAVYRVRRVSP